LTQDKGLIVFSATLPFPGMDAYMAVQQELGLFMVRLKGAADMASSRSRIHDLAAALQKYVKEKGKFPLGTFKRDPTAEHFLPWAADQRVSWMADLLPYLGEGDFKDLRIDGEKWSWQEGDNLRAASVVIPQFISHSNPNASPLITYPGVPLDVAATNYIGVAGVGRDAADNPPGNPKNGVFGYYRETKPDDVKDGLDKTIVLLQIKPGLTPWLAGGGATVRGVTEGPDVFDDFASADYQGKHGTFAIMGDFKVRFIPDDIDPNMFRALCTIAGGEKIDNLDVIAPVVPDDAAPDPTLVPDKPFDAVPPAPAEGPKAAPPETPKAPAPAPTPPGLPPKGSRPPQ
jgi:hypothetical protein